jgi:3-hydroxymyristoyl/3-hydroxydecanoyl-(acyl carrier protein) dehydratase
MSASQATYAATLRIQNSHPALPGHFPDQPVVPGVVLLDHVLSAAEQWLGAAVRLRSLQQAKFVAPLLPDQDAQIQLKLQGTELRFTVTRLPVANGAEVIAQGVMSIIVSDPLERPLELGTSA